MAQIFRERVMANTAPSPRVKSWQRSSRGFSPETQVSSASVREQLLEIAERFEKLARRRERRNGVRPKAHC